MSYLVTKALWDSTSVPQRVLNCKFVGLEGKVAGKEWEALDGDERLALTGVTGMLGLLGKSQRVYEPFADEEARRAKAERVEKLAVGMRSITDNIVAKILGKGD